MIYSATLCLQCQVKQHHNQFNISIPADSIKVWRYNVLDLLIAFCISRLEEARCINSYMLGGGMGWEPGSKGGSKSTESRGRENGKQDTQGSGNWLK